MNTEDNGRPPPWVYTQSEVEAMSREERGVLCRRLRIGLKLSAREVQVRIGLKNNGHGQIVQWENYGTLCQNEDVRKSYFRLLGIEVSE